MFLVNKNRMIFRGGFRFPITGFLQQTYIFCFIRGFFVLYVIKRGKSRLQKPRLFRVGVSVQILRLFANLKKWRIIRNRADVYVNYAPEVDMISRAMFISIFKNAAASIISGKDDLTAIDAKFGDGDHGITMEKVAAAFRDAMDGEGSLKNLLHGAARAIMTINGGSAVPLWNTFFEGLAKGLDGQETGEISETAFKRMFAYALDEMNGITKAKSGDKTMMDALIPGARAIINSPSDDINEILKAGTDAAKQGAQATIYFVSKFGRAKNYKEATIGTMDCGAMSMLLFFSGLKYFEESYMKMKKFINNPQTLTQELLEGLALAHGDVVELVNGNMVVSKTLKDANRVTIVTLGGTGHEPALSGFVGDGMLDISVAGDIFAAPNPQIVFEAIKLADKGKGVLLLVLNHAGDMLTGNKVMQMAENEKLNVRKVVTQEDISNASRSNADDRRGLAGAIPLYHITAAAAKEGRSLDEVANLAQRYADSMATIAVAARCATHPATGMEFGNLGDIDMEIGMGQHGEGGGGRMPLKTAKETIKIMANALVKDIPLKSGDKVFVMINGSGATTLMEMFILFKDCVHHLESLGIKVVANMVGEILTVQEQAGFQLNIAKWDDEFIRLWSTPAASFALRK
jgi:dihydroxyacetone kinase-like protein